MDAKQSCKLCKNEDNNDMVQCDDCDQWYHFICLNVTQNIANVPWKCIQCLTNTNDVNLVLPTTSGINKNNTNKSVSSMTSRTSEKKRKALLELEKMKEFEQLEKQLNQAKENEIKQLNEVREKEIRNKMLKLEEKYKLMKVIEEESYDESTCSSRRSEIRKELKNKELVEQWIKKTQQNKSNAPLPITKESFSNTRFNHVYIKDDYNNNNENDGNVVNTNNYNVLTENGANRYYLTKEQIAARQVMGKDLPYFNGMPSDWPLFISTYERTTKMCNFSHDENLVRLTKCLKGEALQSVRFRLLLPENVPNIINTLTELYGRPEIIIYELLNKVKNVPSPKDEKLETIVVFANAVENVCAIIVASNIEAHLNNPTLIYELVKKLPIRLKYDWAYYRQNEINVNLITFSEWLSKVATAINAITFHVTENNKPHKEEFKTVNHNNRRRVAEKYYVNNSHNEQRNNNQTTSTNIDKKCCVCQGSCATVLRCDVFKSSTQGKKWFLVKKYNLCRICLSNNHKSNMCRSNKICGKYGCNLLHNEILHWENGNENQTNTNIQRDTSQPKSSSQLLESIPKEQTIGIHHENYLSILYKIIPVFLYGKNKSIKVYAYFDDGSSATLIDEQICEDLELDAIPEPMCLKWTDGSRRQEENSNRCDVQISSIDNPNKKYNLTGIHTVEMLDLPTQSINMNEIREKYSYLKNIPICSYKNEMPRILIGLRQSKLISTLKTRSGDWNEPVATKTRLGWTLHGNINNRNKKYCDEYIHNVHQCECIVEQDKNIHNLVKEHFALENLGVVKSNWLESNEVLRSREILKETTKRKDDRFEVGLLWKYDKFILPKSFEMAKNRLICLENKMKHDPIMAKNLMNQIKEYESKDYIRKLSKDELKINYERVWYLPVFPVINKSKPGKVRMVWYAAAKSNGISLNTLLLKGPDELSSLITVLFQFRERKYAICGDIKEMFHQVKIRPEDQQVQRFLWRNENTSEIETYVMKVMTFGATCSPSCAQYIKNLNADEYMSQCPKASYVIKNNHYVDDFLYSVDSEDEAIYLANEVKYVHKQAGFEIGKWLSNSVKVMDHFGEESHLEKKNMNINVEESSEKVLGMWWNRKNDIFTYSLKYNKTNQEILSGNCIPTKREVLRTLMSVFDPLGLIAHFMVYLKILLQNIWRSTLDWDDHITDEQYQDWLRWIKLLPQVEQLEIPRCYLKINKFTEISDIQLHIFVDASEKAYSAVAYIRVKFQNNVECSLVGSKTRVAPLKPLSIPRLELEAAVLGSRYGKSICESHSINISKRVFWTDSKTIMCWLNSEARNYKQFVAFRIGEILEITNLNEWRWIPTKENPADEATKWNTIPHLTFMSRWFQGPQFLKNDENNWPENVTINFTKLINEELRVNVHQNLIKINENLIEPTRFSNWMRMLRALAYVFRFINNISVKRNLNEKIFGPLTQSECERAENHLYKQAQYDYYASEIKDLKYNVTEDKKKINKNSKIYKLSPYLDNYDILRVHGRIDNSLDIQFDTKRPIIMPHEHYITQLLLKYYHKKYHYHNFETVINEVKQKYCISKLRTTINKIRKLCQYCKNLTAVPQSPEMSALPSVRMKTFTRPFTYAGIDYFGPMMVVHGRRSEKRWGVIITCLTTRAVHIEIANSLTIDSCILAIRKFIARRGQPREFYSDNGTNFHGTERELFESFQKINKDALVEEFTSSLTKWHFIPPASPHMGGCWERLVRSIKKTLYHIMPTRNPTDEMLYSMLMEVESIVNSRPLTEIPLDNECDEAITPNHFLLGSTNGSKPIGEFNDDGKLLKQNWMPSQKYADLFWKRWIKEYLPTLTRRTKWYESVRSIEKDDVVIIVDENHPRCNWPKGIILETIYGKDGKVRSAIVQTSFGIYERPSVKLALLDVKPQKEDGKSIEEINKPGGSVTSSVAATSTFMS